MALELVIRKAGAADQVVPLTQGRSTVGRADTNDIVLADIGVSRKHLSLLVNQDGTVVAQDLGSGNGTWLKGTRLEGATPIRHGEILLVDPFTIEIRSARPAPRYTPRSEQVKSSAEARLDVVNGPNLAQGSYLVPMHGLSMGRSEFRDVVLLDPAASRHHCDVLKEGGTWFLKDRGSSNGVHLNGERVTSGRLDHGDTIRIGNTEIRFVLLDAVVSEYPDDGSAGIELLQSTHDSHTPAASELRTQSNEEEHTLDPPSDMGPATLDRPTWRGPAPWLAAAATMAAVALATIAIAAVSVGVIVALTPPEPSVALLPQRAPLPPTWTLKTSEPPSNATVESLFEQGVDAMREGRPTIALRSFRTILMRDPGNRAAERWSFTAGEHVMLDHMQSLMEAERTQRAATEKTRDDWIAKLPSRRAERALRQDFRDDPVVLVRMGWVPSQTEGELARQLDEAFAAANASDLQEARQIFASVAKKTRNPALAQRARFGSQSIRRALAAQVATDWRVGIEAEMVAELDTARSAYRRVLAVDRNNPSARARLSYLGNGPEESAEVRP